MPCTRCRPHLSILVSLRLTPSSYRIGNDNFSSETIRPGDVSNTCIRSLQYGSHQRQPGKTTRWRGVFDDDKIDRRFLWLPALPVQLSGDATRDEASSAGWHIDGHICSLPGLWKGISLRLAGNESDYLIRRTPRVCGFAGRKARGVRSARTHIFSGTFSAHA